MQSKGAIVYSIDISPKLIESYKQRATLNNLNVDFREMDACNLEFKDYMFDIITGFRVIHHLPDLKKFFTEAHRCLKKDGFLLVVEPQKNNPFVELGRRFIKNKEGSRTPTEHPLISKDIKNLKKLFGNVKEKHFEFLKVIALAFGNRNKIICRAVTKILTPVDNVLRHISFLKPFYWQVVLKAYKT